MGVELLEKWPQHYGGVVTGNNSGVFPDSIMMSGYYFYTQASAPQKTIRISGLKNDKKYNLVFFGSRFSTGPQVTYFTANGQTVSLNATGNSTETTQINKLTPNQGVIDVVVKADMGKYAVINALVIHEYDDLVFFPPFNLNMDKSTRNSISLSWKSNAANVTAFEVWRSDTPNGTYVKLTGAVPGDVFTYTDVGLTAGMVYYYKVRAVSGAEFSDYSDYISATTIKYAVNINFNDGIAPEPLPWNNTDLLYNGYKLTNLVDDNNLPTGINLTVVDNFSGFNNWGMTTGSNSGVVSDNIMQEFYYVQYGETARLMIDGLSFGAKYNFTFFGSCDNRATGTLTGLYTIGEKTVQLDARNNTQNTIQINNVEPDAEGRVIITIQSLAPGYGFVNSINIQAVPLDPASQGAASSLRQSNSHNSGSQLSTLISSTAKSSNNETVVTAYPVPLGDEIVLRFSLNKPVVERLLVTLIDNTGRPLFSQELRELFQGTNERKLNVNGNSLTPGIYFIRVTGWKDEPAKIIRVVK
jgi:hypothetical protein